MEFQTGPHLIQVEDDIIITRLHGTFTLEHAQTWCQISEDLIAKYGGIFSISDFRAGGTIQPESRCHIGQWPGVPKVRGLAMFGASLMLRVIMTMIVRAAKLLRNYTVPLITVATETEARAWIAEQRRIAPGAGRE